MEGTVATTHSDDYRCAVCGGHEMRRGRHYATFTLRSLGGAMLGVVGPGFAPPGGAEATASPQGWVLRTLTGDLRHAGRSIRWAGQTAVDELKGGDVVVRLPLRTSPQTRGSHCVRCRACCSTSTRRP